jgi:hypothetical protein
MGLSRTLPPPDIICLDIHAGVGIHPNASIRGGTLPQRDSAARQEEENREAENHLVAIA